MDEDEKLIIEFLNKLHLERQQDLFDLKNIKLAKKLILRQERNCKDKIRKIEQKMKSEVMTNKKIMKRFGIEEKVEIDDEDDDRGF